MIRYSPRVPSKSAPWVTFPKPGIPRILSRRSMRVTKGEGLPAAGDGAKRRHSRDPPFARNPLLRLTAREMEILRLLQCRQEPLRNRVAGPLLLQNRRQHLVDHAPQAWRTHVRCELVPIRNRGAAWRDRAALRRTSNITTMQTVSLGTSCTAERRSVYRHASRGLHPTRPSSVFVPPHRRRRRLPVVWYLSA